MNIVELKAERADLVEENETILAKDTPTKEELDLVEKNNALIEDYNRKIELKEKQEVNANKKFAVSDFGTQKASQDEVKLHNSFSIARAI